MRVGNIIDFESILDSKTYNLSFYKSYSAELVNFLKNNGPCTFANLIAHLGGGERRVIRLVDQMVKQKLIFFRKGKFTVPDSNKTYAIEKLRCSYCDSKLINISGLLELRLFMKQIINNRPSVNLGYDQRPVNVDTLIRRVGYMIMRSDIQGKRVAVIGDDDLNSVAIAFTQLPQEVVVFDIDSRVLNYINAISEKYGLKIKTIELNLLSKLDKEYQNYFDTFITDPTPNLKPLYLFTLRGMQMLKKEIKKTGYISLYPSHMDMSIQFQKILSRMNLLITDLIPHFNQYEILESTLTENDKKLFTKFAVKDSISFSEYFMRVSTTSNSQEIRLRVNQKDLIGKASKQTKVNKKKV